MLKLWLRIRNSLYVRGWKLWQLKKIDLSELFFNIFFSDLENVSVQNILILIKIFVTYFESVNENFVAAPRNVGSVFAWNDFSWKPVSFVERPTYVNSFTITIKSSFQSCGWDTTMGNSVNPVKCCEQIFDVL